MQVRDLIEALRRFDEREEVVIRHYKPDPNDNDLTICVQISDFDVKSGLVRKERTGVLLDTRYLD